MNSQATEHVWFTERIATYLAGGLEGEELSRFESHAAECERCTRERAQASDLESHLGRMFESAAPAGGFEDRIITRLREDRPRRLRIHPLLFRAAATAATVALVGGVGYMATQKGRNDVRTQSNLRQIGQAFLSSSNDSKASYLGRSLASPPVPGLISSSQLAASSNNHDEQVSYVPNPFSGIQRDTVAAGRFAVAAGQIPKLPYDRNESVLVPTDGEARSFRSAAGLAIADAFKPSEFVSLPPSDKKLEDTVAGPGIAAVPAQVADKLQDQGAPRGELGKSVETQSSAESSAPPTVPTTTAVTPQRVIRNGQIEFEVDSFDSALSTITKIVAEESGFIATTNSAKLDNGKVKGTVVVRVPPERLDSLVLKLRGLGDLKRQNLTAQDVSKEYSDLESELRGARAMEERLLDIIKNGKGAIKDLLAAEKELAVWRGKLEQIEGQISYYNNLISLSTLSIELAERNISTAAAAIEQENVNAGVETEDVEKSRAETIKRIDELKGRIIESELKKLDAGQLAAKIVAEVSADSAGQLIDRLKQLGTVARLDIERKQATPSGAAPAENARTEQKPTQFIISLYNLANVAPRETTNLNLACDDVEAAYRAILKRVRETAGGRVVSSGLNRAEANQITGTISFEVRSADAATMLNDVRGACDVMRMDVTENPDTANVTASKRGFVVQLFAVAQIAPRETASVNLAASDVAGAFHALVEAARASDARILTSQLDQKDLQNVSGTIDLEIRREKRQEFEKAMTAAGEIVSRNVARSAAEQNTIDSKVRMQISLASADRLPPRQTNVLGVEVRDVELAAAKITSLATSVGGRVADSNLSKEPDGRTIARLALDVPLAQAGSIVDQIKSSGAVRLERESHDAQVPEGTLSRARIELTLATPDAIVSGERGLWSSIRSGLSTSAAGLMWSLQIIVVGLCFVVPWALILWGAWRVFKRTRRVTTTASV